MSITWEDIFQAYLADEGHLQYSETRAQKRMQLIPRIQSIINRFLQKEINLKKLCEELTGLLANTDRWGAMGTGFMMELNKLAKYHCETSREPEQYFRYLLTRLNFENEGQRIEECYNFLLRERERVLREGKTSHQVVAPRSSAMLISLFAFWIDPDHRPIIYWDFMRKGLYHLIEARLFDESLTSRIRINNKALEVTTNEDHVHCVALRSYIAQIAPSRVIEITPYWLETFLAWILDHLKTLHEPITTLIKESDETTLQASSAASHNGQLNETHTDYALTQRSLPTQIGSDGHIVFANTPLQPTPEPLLTDLIHEIQKHIFIDEHVVRRIYHALLAGHIILSGPPGTGKTELARIIPEILWQRETSNVQGETNEEQTNGEYSTTTAYTTRLITATDDWTPRTLISNIVPTSHNGTITYKTQLGHLAATILKNWAANEGDLDAQRTVALQRRSIKSMSGLQRGIEQQYRGLWLIIDEFNRAPIDLALGEAMTSLSTGDHLRVTIEGGSAELPIPQDFRIIGTLNSFDRNYLNQISEALKRRFSFIEILPPTHAMREAEQGIVLYKALQKVRHLTEIPNSPHSIAIEEDSALAWKDFLSISTDENALYTIIWNGEHSQTFCEIFDAAWDIFEVIRIYRQLGTAQAITLVRHMLIAGLLQGYTTREQWLQALDAALCDTVADQLQVLLPDELAVLLLYLTSEREAFQAALQCQLDDLGLTTHNRLYRQLLAFGSVSDEQGQPYLTDTEIERIAAKAPHTIPTERMRSLFHLDQELPTLPQFTRRLRTFKAERGL